MASSELIFISRWQQNFRRPQIESHKNSFAFKVQIYAKQKKERFKNLVGEFSAQI